jgi:hypothetical protein
MSVLLTAMDVAGIEADLFIETGSGTGDSLAQMVMIYSEIHTIEWDRNNYDICVQRFAQQSHVHCHLGSSPDVLPLVIDPRKMTLFFLDAHYRGCGHHEQDPTRGECPLLAELAVITAVKWERQPVIIIDDAKRFTDGVDPVFDVVQWPTFNQVRDALFNYDLTVRNEMIYGVPKYHSGTIRILIDTELNYQA